MCGITGFVDWKRHAHTRQAVLEKMTAALSLRGPDETNYWTFKHTGFGHKRLSVVDLEGGKQPMSKIKNGFVYTIVYNGELYNTEELRQTLLKKGYVFQTASDTEVLLTAYLEWKEDCVHYLNGIYAFGVWDEKRNSFLCPGTVWA